MSHASTEPSGATSAHDRLLFIGCFIALVTTSFGFIVRAMLIDEWGRELALTETQKGEISGVGLWPFAISIVLFSLVVDKVGYGRSMVFAFICHALSVALTVTATSYWQLYVATFVCALGNGTVEAVINPVVATMFSREKTKWLNILHAGWPGGLVLGGLIAVGMGAMDWRYKVALLVLPTIGYALILWRCKFPVQERVAAGVPYRDMLGEVGLLGALVVVTLIVKELGRVFGFSDVVCYAASAGIALGFGVFTRSIGKVLFFVLLLVMLPLATTELGTDGWITSLMQTEMKALELNPGWVLIYTSFIMMVLRFCAGAIVHRLSPLMLLAVTSAIAAVGLFWLSKSAGAMIFAAASLYGVGKTFFWPTMLGVVSERFPKGGALTLNAISGVGMIGVGVVGLPLLGFLQDTSTSRHLAERAPELHARVTVEHDSLFGAYTSVDGEKRKSLAAAEATQVAGIENEARKATLATVAIFPIGMLVAYLLLAGWFKARGGYKAEHLEASATPPSS